MIDDLRHGIAGDTTPRQLVCYAVFISLVLVLRLVILVAIFADNHASEDELVNNIIR